MIGVQNRVTQALLVLVLLALLGVLGMLATGVRGGPLDPLGPPGSTSSVRLPGTPISGPTTIAQPGHYYLTNDINVTGAVNAISISASNVSLDLGGFTVDGNDTGGTTGIIVTGSFTDVHIENGTVRDFHVGVNVNGAQRARIERVNTVSNIRGMEIGTHSLVAGCMSSSNTESGIVILGDESVLRECAIVNNDADGVHVLGARNLIERMKIDRSLLGQYDIRTSVEGAATTIRDNDLEHIRIESTQNKILDNVCAYGGTIILVGVFVNTIPATSAPHGNVGCEVVQQP
jgi:hypothetical protein